mmetsp:Transcript_4992/g.6645  ORF Transcript_4992/g.6645 Transcript_4992/m.6645 type:complete len:475 (+) Transcript_4992:1-1425(+)
MECTHDVLCDFASVEGMNCDGRCERVPLRVGEPLLSCRECNIDICSDCWTEKLEKKLKFSPKMLEKYFVPRKSCDLKQIIAAGKDSFGWTVLDWAIFKGRIDLLSQVSNLQLFDFDLASVALQLLVLACLSENLDTVRLVSQHCLDSGVAVSDLVQVQDRFRRSLLKCASESTLPVFEFILHTFFSSCKVSTELNKLQEDGLNVLHRTVLEGKLDLLQILVKSKLDLDVLTDDGFTALNLALTELEGECRYSVVRSLVEAGADQKLGLSANENRATPLMIAAGSGDIQTVKLLIEHGADVNAKDCDGATVLYYSVKYVISVVDLEGSVDQQGKASNENAEVLLHLCLEHGAEVNESDNDGITPLILACGKSCSLAVKKLLTVENLNVNQSAEDGNTALHYAVTTSNSEIVQLLLHCGANSNQANRMGFTPLHSATQISHQDQEIVRTLIEHNAKTDCRTLKEELTPLHLAALFL